MTIEDVPEQDLITLSELSIRYGDLDRFHHADFRPTVGGIDSRIVVDHVEPTCIGPRTLTGRQSEHQTGMIRRPTRSLIVAQSNGDRQRGFIIQEVPGSGLVRHGESLCRCRGEEHPDQRQDDLIPAVMPAGSHRPR